MYFRGKYQNLKKENKMKVKEYLKLFSNTLSDDYFEVDKNIEHGMLGISTEISELVSGSLNYDIDGTEENKLNIIEEIGDVYWYMSLLCKEYLLDYDTLDQISSTVEPETKQLKTKLFTPSTIGLTIISGGIIDLLKRAHFYKNCSDFKQALIWKMAMIHNVLKDIIDMTGVTFEYILDINMKKLKTRYPDGFKSTDAINRDIQEEIKGMKG